MQIRLRSPKLALVIGMGIAALIVFTEASTYAPSTTLRSPSSRTSSIFSRCEKAIQKLGQFLVAKETLIHFYHERGLAKKSLRLGHELAILGEWLLSPFPLRFIPSPTGQLFEKLLKDSRYQPTKEELKLLEKYRGTDVFHLKQNFMTHWPRWVQLQKFVRSLHRVALAASFVLVLNHGFRLQAQNETQEAYLTQPEFSPRSNEVQLINEVFPLPHSALRIGDKVFSPGISHITSSTIEDYMKTRTQAQTEERIFLRETLNPRPKRDSLAYLKIPLQKLGQQLAKAPRSVQVITLVLTEKEIDRLKRDLELQTGRRYTNIAFVNDCTTMIFRALSRNTSIQVNRLIDASPGQVALYFSWRRSMGDPLVGPIYSVLVEGDDRPTYHYFRNLYWNALESRFFIDLFFFNQAHRAYIDLTKSERDLISVDPEVQAEIESWRESAKRQIDGETQVIVFRDQVRQFKLNKWAEYNSPQALELEQGIANWIDRQIEDAAKTHRSPKSNYHDIVFSEYRLEYLFALKVELLQAFLKSTDAKN